MSPRQTSNKENFILLLKLKKKEYFKQVFLIDSVEQWWINIQVLLEWVMPEYVWKNLHSI